jgi:hypothetical protein
MKSRDQLITTRRNHARCVLLLNQRGAIR